MSHTLCLHFKASTLCLSNLFSFSHLSTYALSIPHSPAQSNPIQFSSHAHENWTWKYPRGTPAASVLMNVSSLLGLGGTQLEYYMSRNPLTLFSFFFLSPTNSHSLSGHLFASVGSVGSSVFCCCCGCNCRCCCALLYGTRLTSLFILWTHSCSLAPMWSQEVKEHNG